MKISTRKDAAARATRSARLLASGLFVLLLITATDSAVAALTEVWAQRYDGFGNTDDEASAVRVDAIGNVVVTGYSNNGTNDDFYTAKYARANGALLWGTRYNGPANGDDRAHSISLDASGNVVVTGYSFNGTNDDYYTAKYAGATGALLWEKRSQISGNGHARRVAVDGGGNVIVTGSGYYTAKYAANDGTLLWEQYHPSGFSFAVAVAVDGNNDVVVTGYAGPGTNVNYYTAKYAATNGALLWARTYDGPGHSGDFAQALALDAAGNVVVTGYSTSNNVDYYTAKYAAADGALLWEKRYNGLGNYIDVANAVAVDGSGNVIVTGSSYGLGTLADYYTAKYAATNGALLWEKRYNNSSDSAQALGVDERGNVVVTGYSTGYSGNGPPTYLDYYTAKYAALDGALIWEKYYDGSAHGDDSPRGLALGPHGMVAVTGGSAGKFGPGAVYDFATVVYREGLSIDLVPTGVRLRFAAPSGRNYNIERAAAVTGPWVTNASLTSTNGIIEYTDTNAPPGSAFYRTSTGP